MTWVLLIEGQRFWNCHQKENILSEIIAGYKQQMQIMNVAGGVVSVGATFASENAL